MRIIDLLKEDSIKLNIKSASKEKIIEQLVDIMNESGNIKNKEEYKKMVLEREKNGTTGVGEGIAIPHGKSNVVSKPRISSSNNTGRNRF